jgi:PAS domain S-box-containing protein
MQRLQRFASLVCDDADAWPCAIAAAIVLGATVLQAVWAVWQLGGPGVAQGASDIIPVPVIFFTALACWRRARRQTDMTRARAWKLIGAASLSWGCGEALWAVYELSGRQPFPSPADAGYLLMIPLAVAGVVVYSAARHPVLRGLRSMVDGMILAGSLLFISWTVVLKAAVDQAPAGVLAQSLALAYPVGDVIILAVVIHVLANTPRDERRSLSILGAGLASIAAADTVFLWFTEHAGYSGGNINDALWTLGFALVAVAALKRTPDEPAVALPVRRTARIVVPYGPLAGALAGAVWSEVRHGNLDEFQFMLGVFIVLAVLARQFVAVRENVALTGTIAAQAEANAFAASILAGTDDAVIGFDTDGRCTQWNAAAERLFGYSHDEIVGHAIEDVVPPVYRHGAIRLIERVRHGAAVRREMGFPHRDGSHVDAAFTVSPVRAADGTVVGVSVIGRNISERKRAERAVRESERRFVQIAERMPVGLAVVNQDLDVVYANDKAFELLGRDGATADFPRSVEDLFVDLFRTGGGPYDIGEIPAIRALRGEHDVVAEDLEVRRPAGAIPLEAWANPIHDEKDRVVLAVAVFNDISERRQAEARLIESEQQLARSNQDLAQFAHIASHDLQEPLRMVSAYLTLLSDRYRGRLDDDADEFIGYAVNGAVRMQALIKGLLSYSRAGTDERVVTPVDCGLIAEQTLNALQESINERGAVVTFDPLPTVTGDSLQLGQLFQNLVANAIKFVPASADDIPRVHISARAEGSSRWCFSVTDNGIGVDPASAARIFQPFTRLHSSSTYPGSGMGLAICQRIVERHGGRLWVEANEVHGSTFRFTLPGADRPRIGRPLQILLAEDNAGDVRLIREALDDGVPTCVHVANNGDDALDYLRNCGDGSGNPKLDLVILDVNLPRKNGLEVLAAAPDVDDIPFAVLSTSSANDDIRRAYELHARCFVTKPFDPREFVDVVRRVRDFLVPTP